MNENEFSQGMETATGIEFTQWIDTVTEDTIVDLIEIDSTPIFDANIKTLFEFHDTDDEDYVLLLKPVARKRSDAQRINDLGWYKITKGSKHTYVHRQGLFPDQSSIKKIFALHHQKKMVRSQK